MDGERTKRSIHHTSIRLLRLYEHLHNVSSRGQCRVPNCPHQQTLYLHLLIEVIIVIWWTNTTAASGQMTHWYTNGIRITCLHGIQSYTANKHWWDGVSCHMNGFVCYLTLSKSKNIAMMVIKRREKKSSWLWQTHSCDSGRLGSRPNKSKSGCYHQHIQLSNDKYKKQMVQWMKYKGVKQAVRQVDTDRQTNGAGPTSSISWMQEGMAGENATKFYEAGKMLRGRFRNMRGGKWPNKRKNISPTTGVLTVIYWHFI